MKQYAKIIHDTNFSGTIFVITNPVDILAYSCYALTQTDNYALRTYQVYGIGLEVDAARAVAYGHGLGLGLAMEDITLYGNHADTFVLDTPLDGELQHKLVEEVKGASASVRRYVPRTVYGPVAAAVKTLEAYAQDLSVHVTLLQEGTHIGRRVYFQFGLPMIKDAPTSKDYKNIVQYNGRAIAKYRHLLLE